MNTLYAKLKITKNKNSEAEIEGEIPIEILEEHTATVLSRLRADFELPGFRRGQVPEAMVKKNVGEAYLLEEAAELALDEAYPAIVQEEKLPVLGHPHVTITKLALGNPVEFKIRVGIVPEIQLPNYKKIGKTIGSKTEPVEVTDKDVDEAIAELLRLRPKDTNQKEGEAPPPAGGPEFTDEYVKTLGNFKDVADFKVQLKENLREEKKSRAKAERREAIAKKLVEETKLVVPEILIEEEMEVMKGRRLEEVKHLNLSMEDYLKQINKTEDVLVKEERTYIERQFKTRFIFGKIAEAEKITADPKDIERELQYLVRRYPDADMESLRRYTEDVLINEKVLSLLEGTNEKPHEPTNTAGTL
ncbi:MAG: trigger factor [Patescibacteria group bacterium]